MGNHYVTCSFQKIKSLNTNSSGSLRTRYEHNYRINEPGNVDPNKDIQEIIGTKDKNYVECWEETIKEHIDNGDMNKVRSNAVLGIECVLSFTNSETANVDLKQWTKESIDWLKEKFGEKNIKSAVLHLDEATPHIHVFIVPIDEKGHLNCKKFINGPKALSEYQTDYANKVGDKYGLKRGTKYKTKRKIANNYKNINRYKEVTIGKAYADAEIIKPRPEELDEQERVLEDVYIPRIQEAVENLNLSHLKEINELKQEVNEQESLLIQREVEIRKEYKKKLELEQRKYNEQLKELQDKLKTNDEYKQQLEKTFTGLQGRIVSGDITLKELSKLITLTDALNRGLKNYPDKEKMNQLANELNKVAEWQHKEDKKLKEEIEQKIGG